MIIFENKGYETRSDKPDSDWTGGALFVVPDGSGLARKVRELCPYYDFVTDDAGKLVDIAATERPPLPPPEPSPEALMDVLLGVRGDE